MQAVILNMVRESKQATLSDLASSSEPSDGGKPVASGDAENDERDDGTSDGSTEPPGTGWPPSQPSQRTEETSESDESNDGSEQKSDAPHPGSIVINVAPRHIPGPTEVEPIEPPEPDPKDGLEVDEEELERAVFSLLMGDEDRNPKAAALLELPRWIDFDKVPDYTGDMAESAGPDDCQYCGTRHPWGRPLERGRAVERAGDDGNPWYQPCQPGEYNIESCTCCVCPSCENKSIYHRQNRSPTYRCRNPRCEAEFEWPVEAPIDDPGSGSSIDGDGVRTRLYWSCRTCQRPVLAPFDGVPDEFFDLDGFTPPR